MMTQVIPEPLDLTGRSVTTFIAYHATIRLQHMQPGETLELLTDHEEAIVSDISAWVKAAGHRLVLSEEHDHHHRFVVQKGVPRPIEHKLAMTISSDRVEDLSSALGFALAAALENVAVHVYFQGPGVRVPTKTYESRLRGVSRPFSSIALGESERAGDVPTPEKLRELLRLGARLYVSRPSMNRFGVERDDLSFNDVAIVEQLSFMAVISEADIHFFV